MEKLNPEEIIKKGEEIYQNKLKNILEPQDNGKYVVIEVISSDYFVNENLLTAVEEARKKYPESLFFTARVGYKGIFNVGTYSKGKAYAW